MSSNNQLIILKQKDYFFVHLDSCVDNQFVPNRNTLLKKFDKLSEAVKYANSYCNEEMIEYSFRLDHSCFNILNLFEKIDKFEKKHICMGANVVTSEDYKQLKGYVNQFVKEVSDEFMRRFYGSDITNKDYEEYLKFIEDRVGDLK